MADSNTVAAGGRPLDERLKRQSTLRKMLSRPELGAVAGTVLVFLFFAVTARGTGMFAADGVLNWITVTAQLTIIATGAALLMVGGEFDLSVGSMIGFAGMMIAIPTVYFSWPIAASVAFAFCGALAIGFLNGLVVVRTRLPSFIVTLASLYILRGMTIALSILFANRTIVSGVKNFAGDSMVGPLFAGKAFPGLFVWLADAGMIGKLPNGQPVTSCSRGPGSVTGSSAPAATPTRPATSACRLRG
jgi:simple sugar transport system permease protein